MPSYLPSIRGGNGIRTQRVRGTALIGFEFSCPIIHLVASICALLRLAKEIVDSQAIHGRTMKADSNNLGWLFC